MPRKMPSLKIQQDKKTKTLYTDANKDYRRFIPTRKLLDLTIAGAFGGKELTNQQIRCIEIMLDRVVPRVKTLTSMPAHDPNADQATELTVDELRAIAEMDEKATVIRNQEDYDS